MAAELQRFIGILLSFLSLLVRKLLNRTDFREIDFTEKVPRRFLGRLADGFLSPVSVMFSEQFGS